MVSSELNKIKANISRSFTGTSEKISVQEDIMDELSWSVKLKLPGDASALKKLPFQNERRRASVEAPKLIKRRQQPADLSDVISPLTVETDENSMKMKLFRLMYETVRDSDLKFKRAELIRTHYSNSSLFDIGFIMGEVTDKFNVISDVSATLQRLYNQWTPIEHINAYEQIANQAIEISHLVDMVRLVNKRNQTLI